MFSNIDSKFLPPPEHQAGLTFTGELEWLVSTPVLNACTALLDDTIAAHGEDGRAYVHVRADRSVEHWSYGRLSRAVHQLAGGLRALGVSPGTRVLTRFSEVPWAAVAQLAIWRVGAIAVPSAAVEAAREIAYMINDTLAEVVICESESSGEVVAALASCPSVRTVIGWPEAVGSFEHTIESVSSGQPATCEAEPTAPLDGSGIYYTGGTTGRPKGCVHTHAGEVAVAVLNGSARRLGPDSVLLCHAPLGHAFGNGEKINFPLKAGASAVLVTRPSPPEMWSLIADHGVTTVAGAATMYRMMLQVCPDPRKSYPGIDLRNALSSGEILDSRTYDRWAGTVGTVLRNCVGMTPMRHLFIDSMADGVKVAPGLSVGLPLPGYEHRLVDPEGCPLDRFDKGPGRLAVRGPTGTTYWTNENPTLQQRAALDVQEGWSLLDDAYTTDEDGWLWFFGRLDDMIVTGGRQVAPVEVEEILGSHPAVSEVAVVGAPDDLRGQVVTAFVTPAPGVDPGPQLEAELKDYAKSRMAGYKYPRQIRFVTSLPKDGVGKVQRRKLRDILSGD